MDRPANVLKEATLYRLYAWPNSYAMGVHAMLEDLGVDYEVRWVKIMVSDLDPDFCRGVAPWTGPGSGGPGPDDLRDRGDRAVSRRIPSRSRAAGAAGPRQPGPVPAMVPLFRQHASARGDDPVPPGILFR